MLAAIQWFMPGRRETQFHHRVEDIMREEFLEPLPTPQTNAKLLLGRSQVACVIVEVTADGFRVAVPGVDHYEGDPKLTLVTRSAVYPVRLVLQEPHTGGFSYRLQRLDQSDAVQSNLSFRLSFLTSHCCAAGLISLIVSGCFCIIPTTNENTPLLTRRGLRYESLGTWSPSIVENDRVPPGISLNTSLASIEPSDLEAHDVSSELQTISVSMISPASLSVSQPALLPQDDPHHVAHSQHGSGPSHGPAKLKKDASLKSLLEEGQLGRIQNASPAMVSWLFGTTPAAELQSMRVSDTASNDLKQFELGLKVLPHESSLQATASLRNALVKAGSANGTWRAVPGVRDIFVVASDDANVYFQKNHGNVELVRVLPIDFKAE